LSPPTTIVSRNVDSGLLERSLVGAKSMGLAHAASLGILVPPALVITVPACLGFRERGSFDDSVLASIGESLSVLEDECGRRLGDPSDPLLVSVRASAVEPMPTMLAAVLDVGIDLDVPEVMEAWTSRGFANNCRDRFVQSYRAVTGEIAPSNPFAQLQGAIEAVLASWDDDPAQAYRRMRGIDHGAGMAVMVQAMVFGNRNERSGAGVVMSRSPTTGEPGLCGDFLVSAQGDEVGAGSRDVRPIDELADLPPGTADELVRVMALLEAEATDLLTVDFTVDDGRLHVLQVDAGAHSAEWRDEIR